MSALLTNRTGDCLDLHGRYISIERPEALTAKAIATSTGLGVETSYTPWA